MDGQSDRLDRYDGLASWWRRAEAVWERNRSSDRLTLVEQLDYHGKLEQQFPIQPERIVYNAFGNASRSVTARRSSGGDRARAVLGDCRVHSRGSLPVRILNSATFTELVRPFMSYGKDERHFDKHIWQLPVPLYDRTDDLHRRLAVRGAELEEAIEKLEIVPGRHFAAVRRDIRGFIADSEAGRDVEALVEELLS